MLPMSSTGPFESDVDSGWRTAQVAASTVSPALTWETTHAAGLGPTHEYGK